MALDVKNSHDLESGVAKSEEDGVTDSSMQKPKELSAAEEDEAGKIYPPAREVAVVMVGLYLSLFLVSLVRSTCPYNFLCNADRFPTRTERLFLLLCQQ